MGPGHARIDKRDYPSAPAETRRLLRPDDTLDSRSSSRPSQTNSYAGSFFEQVAEQIQERDRQMMRRAVTRYGGYACAILSWCVTPPDACSCSADMLIALVWPLGLSPSTRSMPRSSSRGCATRSSR